MALLSHTKLFVHSIIALALMACTSAALGEPMSKIEQKVYLKACIGENAPMKAYCECTLAEVQNRMTVEEFRALGNLSEKEALEDEKFSDAIVACVNELPQSSSIRPRGDLTI
jgi:hypothetical protein